MPFTKITNSVSITNYQFHRSSRIISILYP